MRTDKKVQRELDKLEKKFDRNYKERQCLEDKQEKLVEKLEVK